MGLELLQSGSDNLGQMALLVTLGYADGFIELAFSQGAGNCGRKLARLFAGRVKGDPAINHDADRPSGHDEENAYNHERHPAHLFNERNGVPTHGGVAGVALKEQKGEQVGLGQDKSCNI